MSATRSKTPSEIKDFGFDWTHELILDDQITASTWAVPTGITQNATSLNTVAVDLDGREVSPYRLTGVVLSGGAHLSDYECTNTVTTQRGLTLIKALTIRVRNAKAY